MFFNELVSEGSRVVLKTIDEKKKFIGNRQHNVVYQQALEKSFIPVRIYVIFVYYNA